MEISKRRTSGTSSKMPHKPSSTDGIAASSSTARESTLARPLGRISTRATAVSTAKGRAMAMPIRLV